MHVDINCEYSDSDFITKLRDGKNVINVIKKGCAIINKFQVNYHRTFKLKHRIA